MLPSKSPLSKSEEQLRGRKKADMTVEQLLDWIEACSKMELSVKANKGRRSWRKSREEARAELAKRKCSVRKSVSDKREARIDTLPTHRPYFAPCVVPLIIASHLDRTRP